MKRFLNYISTRKFAVYLLVATTAVILLSNLLPNLSSMDARDVERLRNERPFIYGMSARWGVASITRSIYFQVIPLFLFASITACTIRRFRDEMEKGKSIPQRLPASYPVVPAPEGFRMEDAALLLEKKRWKVLSPEGDSKLIYARKGDGGVWGSLVFHIGMDVVLIGILLSATTSSTGKLLLTEGFPVSVPAEIKGMKDVRDFPLREIMLGSFGSTFRDGFPVDYSGKLVGVGSGGTAKKYEIGVNRYLDIDDYKLIFNKVSFAPRLVLKKKDGETVVDAVANLLISMPGIVDYVDIPEEGLRVKVEMFPDYYEENGAHKTRGSYPNNPVLFVEVERDGKVIGRGFLHKNKAVIFDSYSLEFIELKYWLELVVSKDMGVPVIMAGFLFMALGLLVRFVLNEKHLWIIIKDTETGRVAELGGRARYFPAMFEEEMKKLGDYLLGQADDKVDR